MRRQGLPIPVQTRLQGEPLAVLEALFRVRQPYRMTLSSDGGLLAVAVGHRGEEVDPGTDRIPPGMPSWVVGQHVYVVDVTDGTATAVRPDAWGSWAPRWSPDGSRLLCFAHAGDSVSLSSWDRRSGAVSIVADRRMVDYIHPVQWTHDGKGVILAVPSTDADSPEPAEPGSGASQPTVDVLFSPRRVDGAPRLSKLHAGAEVERADIGILDLASGQFSTLVAGASTEQTKISPDRRWIAVLSRSERPGLWFGTVRDLDVFDTVTGDRVHRVERLTGDVSGSSGPAWSPDSRQLAMVRDGRVLVQRMEGDLTELSGPGPVVDRGQSALLWSPDGDVVVGVCAAGDDLMSMIGAGQLTAMYPTSGRSVPLDVPDSGRCPVLFTYADRDVFWTDGRGRAAVVGRDPDSRRRQLRWVPLDGEPASVANVAPVALPPCDGLFLGSYSDVAEDRVYYRAESETSPPEIFSFEPSGEVRRVTTLNVGLRDWGLEPATVFNWMGPDRAAYRGALTVPSGYDGSNTVPVVVDTYPAPNECDDFDRWEDRRVIFRQVLLAEGYAVFTPSRVTAPDHGWLDLDRHTMDRFILSGVDELVRRGIADDRLALMGQSHGGYMVDAVLTTTDRFKAAVAGVGYANLSSWFGQLSIHPDGTDYTHGVALAVNHLGGPPCQYPKRYVDQSPVFHADKITTPRLSFHGTADIASHPHQGDEMFVNLKWLGREVTCLRYHGGGHGARRYTEPNRSHLIDQILMFLHRHLRGAEQSE